MAASTTNSMQEPIFAWPAGFAPGTARSYLRNERTIDAPPERVWATLVAAARWHDWFPNATRVRIEGDADALTAGARFRWSQTGVPLVSEVREFVPLRRLGWSARSPLIRAYHAWDIQPLADGGCHVITDETQNGVMPTLGGRFMHARMLRVHDLWLERLAATSEASRPFPR